MELKQLSEYRATICQAWAGNVTTHSPDFVTDGHILILVSAISRSDHERLNRRKRRTGRTVTAETVRSLWEYAIDDTAHPATPLGVDTDHSMSEPDRVWLDDGTATGIAVDARKLSYLLRITKADRILTRGPKLAMVLTRTGKPVALVMPINADRINMEAARETAAKLAA